MVHSYISQATIFSSLRWPPTLNCVIVAGVVSKSVLYFLLKLWCTWQWVTCFLYKNLSGLFEAQRHVSVEWGSETVRRHLKVLAFILSCVCSCREGRGAGTAGHRATGRQHALHCPGGNGEASRAQSAGGRASSLLQFCPHAEARAGRCVLNASNLTFKVCFQSL